MADRLQRTPAERPVLGEGLGTRVQALADEQYGVVGRSQLTALGLSGSAVSRWARSGRLQRIHPGVYAVGHRRIRREGWWMAALLLGGPETLLAGWTAVTGWALLQHGRTTVHIIPGGRRGTTARGVQVHRTTLAAADRAEHDGFPLTSVARTIVDVADEATDRQLGAMLDTALHNGLYDRSEMATAVDRAFGVPGVGRLVALLGTLGDEGTLFRSTTERTVRDRLVAAGVPRALVNVPVAKGDGTHYELDLLWPRIGLNIEIDGPQHLLPFQAAADATRDAWLTARRFRVVRFPVERVDEDFPAVLAEIRALVEP